MPPRRRGRDQALSRERIVEVAVELLDASGESGLTFRALASRLATGPGALYWHVDNRDELLAAATGAVLAPVLTSVPEPAATAAPAERIRAVALGLFDVIDEHPWLATTLAAELSHHPWGAVTAGLVESVGREVAALGVPEEGWFTATFALVHYVLGAAGQNATNRRLHGGTDREAFLDAAARAWEALDPQQYPVTRVVAGQVRHHDDRAEFLAGVDLVLAGITAVHPSSRAAQP